MRNVVWLTLKQHRFEVLAVSIVCIGLAAAAVIEAFRLNALNVPPSCLTAWQGVGIAPSSGGAVDASAVRCHELAGSFFAIRGGLDMSLTQALLLFVPLVAGVLLGAPIAAREIEQRTASLSWVHSSSRRRWLATKMLTGIILMVPLMTVVGLSADFLEAASAPTLNTYASFDLYLSRGLLDISWALAAFMGTVALATIFGRTLPAVIVALLICLVVRESWDAGMTHVVLRPFAVRQVQASVGGPFYDPQADMYLYGAFYLDGKPFQGDVYQWYMDHAPTSSPQAGPTQAPTASSPSDNSTSPSASVEDGPSLVRFVIPGAWYWNVVAFESGMLLLGSLLCLGVAMVSVDRRRPY